MPLVGCYDYTVVLYDGLNESIRLGVDGIAIPGWPIWPLKPKQIRDFT